MAAGTIAFRIWRLVNKLLYIPWTGGIHISTLLGAVQGKLRRISAAYNVNPDIQQAFETFRHCKEAQRLAESDGNIRTDNERHRGGSPPGHIRQERGCSCIATG